MSAKKKGRTIRKTLEDYDLLQPLLFLGITAGFITLILLLQIPLAGLHTQNQTNRSTLNKTLFNITLISEQSCTDCYDVRAFADGLALSTNSNYTRVDVYDRTSERGKQLIERYNITLVPTIIFSPRANQNTTNRLVLRLSTVEDDGNLVMRYLNPPYKNLTSNTVLAGQPNITFIINQECSVCFTIDLFIDLFRAYGIYSQYAFVLSHTSEHGKEIIARYNITAIPSVVLDSRGAHYTAFMHEAWPELGSIETDGALVFRNVSAVGNGAYFDLVLNQTLLT
ncbi:hypothetical protein COT72_01435 [archaeon CG10_big_fil_rev_8_21_14_0_10_43_11]|nr:MAG: hypothetical protein COT72_01435 [archaeon CG10_big_fil_rev_8_21_14_0_10_43_11]